MEVETHQATECGFDNREAVFAWLHSRMEDVGGARLFDLKE